MANPANRLPPQYDDLNPDEYDPTFTVDISTQMRVPDRIGLKEAGDNAFDLHDEQQRNATMSVPDKIVMIGHEQSAGMKKDPQLHLEFMQDVSSEQHLGLQTPPRVITLDEQLFPSQVEQEGDDDPTADDAAAATAAQQLRSSTGFGKKDQLFSLPNGLMGATPQKRAQVESLLREASMATPGEPLLIQNEEEDDLTQLRRQVAKLSRHVMRLEEENSKRGSRELFLYPLVISYFLFQVTKWFLARN